MQCSSRQVYTKRLGAFSAPKLKSFYLYLFGAIRLSGFVHLVSGFVRNADKPQYQHAPSLTQPTHSVQDDSAQVTLF